MSSQRLGLVSFSFNCEHCSSLVTVSLTNDEWEQSFWMEDTLFSQVPLVSVTCPECNRSTDVNLS